MNEFGRATGVLCLDDIDSSELQAWFESHGLKWVWHPPGADIPGTYWGEPEAGLIGDNLHIRGDTPVQSACHEGCHWVCLTPHRRTALHTDVGGSALEECATCYLQVILATKMQAIGKARMLHDMDCWGYSFRLGSASAWFEEDARDARDWLFSRGLITRDNDLATGPL